MSADGHPPCLTSSSSESRSLTSVQCLLLFISITHVMSKQYTNGDINKLSYTSSVVICNLSSHAYIDISTTEAHRMLMSQHYRRNQRIPETDSNETN